MTLNDLNLDLKDTSLFDVQCRISLGVRWQKAQLSQSARCFVS